MTDRATLEALMNGPIQRTAHMTHMPCPRCDAMTVAASGAAHWCVAAGCGWSALVKRGDVHRAARTQDPRGCDSGRKIAPRFDCDKCGGVPSDDGEICDECGQP